MKDSFKEICSKITGFETLNGAFLVHTDNADIKLHFVTDEIIRLRASFDKEFAEESYVLSTTAWDDRLDLLFEGERIRLKALQPTVTEKEDRLVFCTAALRLELDRNPICIRLYDDDGVTNDYRKGIFRKTVISMSGESVVTLSFESEGSYTDFVETVTVEMIRKDRSPFWVSLENEKLEHFLNRRKFEEAEKGWYYSQAKRAVLIKYPNPKKNVTLTVSFEDFDLIGMANE